MFDWVSIGGYTGFVAKRNAKAAGNFHGRLFRKYTVILRAC